MSSDKKKSTTIKGKSPEEIVQGFQKLRQDQRQLAAKISELEIELTEHKLVIETLETVDETRKCFRLVGGVLVERTVKEVLPAVKNNREKLGEVIEVLNSQLKQKGIELIEYKEKYSIKIQGQDELMKKSESEEEKAHSGSGILVESKS